MVVLKIVWVWVRSTAESPRRGLLRSLLRSNCSAKPPCPLFLALHNRHCVLLNQILFFLGPQHYTGDIHPLFKCPPLSPSNLCMMQHKHTALEECIFRRIVFSTKYSKLSGTQILPSSGQPGTRQAYSFTA